MNVAHLPLDPYDAEFLRDPYPFHEQMREAGPLVRLDRYDVWALARHAEVHATLNQWQTFCSAAGVGLSDFRKEKPWRTPSLLLETDPPVHVRTRGVITGVLSRRALQELRAPFAAEAERLVGELLERGEIDAIREIAEAYPLKVFPDAVGLEASGRQPLIEYGAMVFNAFGPRNERLAESARNAESVVAWISDHCQRHRLEPGKLGARIYEAADAGSVTEAEAGLLVRSLLTAGVDTTVHAIGNLLVCCMRHPDQWQALRESPELARNAFDEAVRFESPVQTFFRTTTQDTEVAGMRVPAGEKVLMFLASANRDPRRWSEPDRFDIRRNTTGHVAFGAGIHACVGQMIARLEGETVLGALARRVARFEPIAEPVPKLNNTLRGWQSMRVRLHAA